VNVQFSQKRRCCRWAIVVAFAFGTVRHHRQWNHDFNICDWPLVTNTLAVDLAFRQLDPLQ
jgi:hypothetical protein